jgi:hypothetical protein
MRNRPFARQMWNNEGNATGSMYDRGLRLAPMRNFRVYLILLALALGMIAPAAAQDAGQDTTRDPQALAARLLGFDGGFALPELTPLYEVGDEAQFWVGKTTSETPTRVTARLAGASPGVYLWVEEGIAYNPEEMPGFAASVDNIQVVLRLRDNYGYPTILPGIGSVMLATNLIDLPNTSGDPHLYILYASDLGNTQYSINYNDPLPRAYVPGGYSNEHNLIVLNTSFFPGVGLADTTYASLLMRAIYDLVSQVNVPQQASWLREALAWFITFQMQGTDLPQDFIRAHFRNPGLSLLQTTQSGANVPVLAGQRMYLDYIAQRLGTGLIRDLFSSPGLGVAAIDRSLAAGSITDPLTGQVITAADLYADFVIASVLNAPIGDGRYTHRFHQLPEDQGPAGLIVRDDNRLEVNNEAVGQYGTQYFYIGVPQTTSIEVSFSGQPITPRLALGEDRALDDRFYWSGRALNQEITMTRAVDLRAVEAATLSFDTWYDLYEAWNYAYVMASADDGATWDILPVSPPARAGNRHGAAYGPGLSGVSSVEGPRPFPYLGIQFAADGMTVTDLVPDAPAQESGLLVGDMIVGYDGALWPGDPSILALLANYRPGDTLDLYVQRGGSRLSVPVLLGAHPERVVLPEPEWLSKSVDLTPYAGQEILLRFACISMPGRENPGIVLDNIAIPQIDFLDNAEAETGWTLHGWQHTDNQVQQNFVVQALSSGTQAAPPGVRQLIRPADAITSGQWTFTLRSNEVMVFTVSGISDDTSQPARFDFSINGTSVPGA